MCVVVMFFLNEMAPSNDSRDHAIAMAEDVYDVRIVYANVDIKPPLSSSQISIRKEDRIIFFACNTVVLAMERVN